MYNASPSLHQQLTSLNNRSLYILYITSPTHGSTISAFAHIVSPFSPLSPHSSILKVAHSLLIYSNYSVMHLMVELHGCSSSHFTLNASLSNVDAGWGDKHVLWKPVNISKDEKEKKCLKVIFCLLKGGKKGNLCRFCIFPICYVFVNAVGNKPVSSMTHYMLMCHQNIFIIPQKLPFRSFCQVCFIL